MTTEQIAFQITYATIDAVSGDPATETERILRDERVLAALREEGGQLVALIPVTEGGDVVALDNEGRLRFDLNTARLRELFAAEGISLHLGLDDDPVESASGHGISQADEADEAEHAEKIAPEPVHVAEFSHRGPWAARVTAQVLGTKVDYIENGTWSLYRYGTDRPHMAVSGGSADQPIIELNLPQFGHAWVEVTTRSGATAMFWPNSERQTRPVLDLAAISTPESAELYRRMLAEADGARDELEELGNLVVDVEAAHRACLPEALGGVVGERERLVAFISAFDVPTELVAVGFESQSRAQHIEPRGWPALIGDLLVGGISEVSALTRRQSPMVRLASGLRKRPLLGAALSTAELTAGVALARSRTGFGRVLGVFLVIDALVDLAIWAARMRRR